MRKFGLVSSLFTIVALLIFTGAAYGQSAGSFTYGNTGGLHCTVSSNNGAITGGATCASGVDCTALGCSPVPALGGACSVDADCASSYCVNPSGAAGAGQCAVGTCGGSVVAGIKTNSGSGNVFDIRPSAVIGLLTDVAVTKNSSVFPDTGTSSAFAGVDFSIVVTPPPNAPTPCISPNFSVTYASRFIQISTNLLQAISASCTISATGCFLSFSESTVSAHSFDWIVGYPDSNAAANGNPACGTLASGVYGIAANWKASLGNTGISEALTCVGPINLVVTQNKIFNFNTVN